MLMTLGAVAFIGYGIVFLFRSFGGSGFELGVDTLGGLTKEGLNLYSGIAAAGPLGGTSPTAAAPGTNGLGRIESGALELSNVDLANEFANMITTQRGFQASARIITTSDEMLQELVNLKR